MRDSLIDYAHMIRRARRRSICSACRAEIGPGDECVIFEGDRLSSSYRGTAPVRTRYCDSCAEELLEVPVRATIHELADPPPDDDVVDPPPQRDEPMSRGGRASSTTTRSYNRQVARSDRTIGKTPTMAFVLDYLRQFPGADYRRVKAAAQTAGVGVPAPSVYGNARRVLRIETNESGDQAGPPAPNRRRRGRAGRGVQDLAGLVEQMQSVVEERDRMRAAVDQIRAALKQLRAAR